MNISQRNNRSLADNIFPIADPVIVISYKNFVDVYNTLNATCTA